MSRHLPRSVEIPERGRLMMRAAVCNAPGSTDLEDAHDDAFARRNVVGAVGPCRSDLSLNRHAVVN